MRQKSLTRKLQREGGGGRTWRWRRNWICAGKGAVTMRGWTARQTTAAGRQMEEICQGGDGGQRTLDGGRRRGGARRLKRRRSRRRRLDSGGGGGGCGASQLARQRRCRIARGAAPGLGRWGAPKTIIEGIPCKRTISLKKRSAI